jgi:PIN domain nuclease of toxin-antitoxin system
MNPDNDLYLSVVSAWELTAKYSNGRLSLPEPAHTYIPGRCIHYDIATLPFTEAAVWHLPDLPHIHRDPFDRMLVCQALAHGLVILSPDLHIRRYGAPVLW